MWEVLLGAALINWIVTTIFVESHLFTTPRNWVVDHTWHALFRGKWVRIGRHGWRRAGYVFPEDTTQEEYDTAAANQQSRGPWLKLAQLITCQLCTRVWVGFAEALYFGGPDHHWAAPVANGLLYAAAGHLIFELRSRVALVLPEKT